METNLRRQEPDPPTHSQQKQHGEHENTCSCSLCLKEQQIRDIRQHMMKLTLQTIYKHDFTTKRRHNAHRHSPRREESLANISVGYVDFGSVYSKEYVPKDTSKERLRPEDNLRPSAMSLPRATTYLSSYHSTMTPKPDQAFRKIEMPIGTDSLPFQAESIYRKAYRAAGKPKPSLPIIQQPNIGRPRSLGVFESTHKRSYSTIDPEATEPARKPPSSIAISPAFTHNYDTTYNRFYVGASTRMGGKHDIDSLGNVNKRRAQGLLF